MEKKPTLTKEELLARATGANKLGAKPQLTVPLPAGKLVAMQPAAAGPKRTLTEMERTQLEAIGWDDSMPIPNNMAEIYAAIVKARETGPIVPAIDPRSKPFVMPEEVEYSSLPKDQKENLRAVLQHAIEVENQQKIEAQQEAAIVQMPSTVRDSYVAASTPSQSSIEVEMPKRPETKPTPAPVSSPAPAPVPETHAEQTPVASDTGAAVAITHCPHCSFDLSVKDIEEPSYQKKMAYLHSILGEIPYRDEFSLLGGHLIVEFRGLTSQEFALIYKQAYRDLQTQKIKTDSDYIEKLNQYRLYLQIASLKTTTPSGLNHELPQGYSAETCKSAKTFWTDKFKDVEVPATDTLLPQIEDFILKEVLTSATLFSVIARTCNQFNRIGSKMEVMVTDENFWKPTVAQ